MLRVATSFVALGTTVTLVVDGDRNGAIAAATTLFEREIRELDASCSRFRDDSDLARVNANAGSATRVSPRCLEAVAVALQAAVMTDGLVSPTIGRAIRVLGYDRDFGAVAPTGPAPPGPVTVPGWQTVEIDREAGTVFVPRGVELDLGATAKALGADRAARAVYEAIGTGVLVSLGGDIATAGGAPAAGWPVRVADDHAEAGRGQTVALAGGGLATSGIARRHWTRGAHALHHLVDPRTGTSAVAVWRTVSVAASSCVDANVASTAAMVMGAEALDWLAARALPARLVSAAGDVFTVQGWPADDGSHHMVAS
jgi:FAD:protein FMN transferase